MTEFRVSTNPDGDKRWWGRGEKIPADHTNIRRASVHEARLMHAILDYPGDPPVMWGTRLSALMAETGVAT